MLGRGLESLIPRKDNKETPETEQKNASSASAPASDFFSSDSPELKKDLAGVLPKPEENLKLNIQEPAPKKDFQELPRKHQEAIFLIEVDEIKPNPHQPRRHFDEESLKELAASIQEFGILQPLLVSKIEEETENGTKVSYQLIAGERRFMAAKMLGLERVPAIIKKIDLETNNLEMAIIENIQRVDLNPIESARAFAKLQDEFRLTQREIAQRVGKSREAVANTLRLLSLPSNIQDALAQKKINESQARMLLTVSDLNQQQALFQELINGGLSVRDLREKINPEETTGRTEDPESKYMENRLEEALGTKVNISKNQNKGKIVIKFFSPEELDAIIKKICQPESE
ncbi:MAG: ParB/RepB/Spo0J family partition protein [bacterium]|nr:ParB/RepB/Spo0J family partition protein [bacterium]